ncbi:MAG: tetratricopeptide repeat protein [Flavobacteriaceae bacterium]|uniref:tetratricopeptide repeat protein n=1 Tax=Flagellimonas sp. SN16 TaxID=3415142 RepID=UPI003C60A236|nr:tetratricopeptide repeat protein [Flavobacteriaceae bacterium]
MKRFINIIILGVVANGIFAQSSMDAGFELLEKGDFSKAENYFGDFLKDNPNNKTAQICYGRAVGLNGNPNKANTLFNGMMMKNPDDYEVRINYYESFLWEKRYKEAEKLYAGLVIDHPNTFGAILGYANTLSNLQKYKEALVWIEKALAIQPENPSALISKKYMNLGLANTLVQAQNYDGAKMKLKSIFKDFPNDREALLNLANVYLITKEVDSAKTSYRELAINAKDSIVALNGIALAEHIGENDKQALKVSVSAKSKVSAFDDDELKERTYGRYAQALIWNRKFVTAKKYIDSLSNQYGDSDWILALRATLGMYTGNIKKSLQQYGAILESDSTSFDGNLGRANALFALGRIEEAYKATYKTLEIFTNQKDAQGLIEKINGQYSPFLQERASYSFDNGNNVAYATTTTIHLPLSTKFQSTFNYQYRFTENMVTLAKANTQTATTGLTYAMLPKLKLMGMVGLNNAQFEGNGYTQPILSTKLITEPYRLQNLELGYQREVQNFNTDLIEREIVMQHYGLNYNLGSNFGMGWYTQLIHTQQSDDNQRDLLFTSLYYTALRKPNLKLGLNYQYLAFTEQVPTIYFSPEQYQAGEFFTELGGRFAKDSSYRIHVATGLQQVEEDDMTSIFRVEMDLKHQFSKRLSGGFYGKYSNIASATATGFQFTEMGIQLKWSLKKQPFFYEKVASR